MKLFGSLLLLFNPKFETTKKHSKIGGKARTYDKKVISKDDFFIIRSSLFFNDFWEPEGLLRFWMSFLHTFLRRKKFEKELKKFELQKSLVVKKTPGSPLSFLFL